MATLAIQPVSVPSPCHDMPQARYREDMPDFSPSQATSEELLVAQLSRLASQHHASEHNRTKFGQSGSTAIYIPMCLYMPEQFKQLQMQQAAHALQQAWWPCAAADVKSEASPSLPKHGRIPPLNRSVGAPDLQEDLLSAMSSPLAPPVSTAPQAIHTLIKTSDTHPINITPIVPPELLPILSAHISSADHLSPVMFNVPLAIQLHRLIYRSQGGSSTVRSPTPPGLESLSLKTGTSSPSASRQANLSNLFWKQKLLCSSIVPTVLNHETQRGSPQHNSILTPFSAISGRRFSANPPTSRTSTAAPCPRPAPVYQAPSVSKEACMFSSAKTELQIEYTDKHTGDPLRWRGITSYSHSAPITNPPACASQPSDCHPQRPKQVLGNLLLSSCPGKKVRIDGPVDGRSGVCRDVYQDMKRIKELGTRCIVCCLDDDELQLLGAPWDEYSRTAHGLGLDILRLPVPEGLAPIDIEAFDNHLQRIIDSYTLRGISVLVHCRGGIGRAGLVACCWTIRLGLCGWLDAQPGVYPSSRLACAAPEVLPAFPPAAIVRKDTLQLLERVISFIRRRRSLKAVETFEQVRFLVEYVEYLRKRNSGGAPASSF